MRSWFHEQLLARAIAAAIWTIVLQVPLVIGLKLLFSGHQGLWNSLSLFLHYGSLFSLFMIPLCICGFTFTHLRCYKTEPLVYSTRWAILKQLSSPSFLLLLAWYCNICGILMNAYFGMTVPFLGSMSTQCSDRKAWCLNEQHLFGIFFGCCLGVCEAWDYFFSDRRLVKVPHVQLTIKVAVRSSISLLIKKSLGVALKRYFVYIFLYLLFGGYVRSYILAVTRLTLDEPLDTIVTLINISLALRCILIGSACVFTIRLCDLFFQLYEIKPISFPIIRMADETSPLLHEAISSDTTLLRLWACRDWNILAEQSAERRSVIFSVSQPGNHPHNWNNVLSAIQPQCLHFIALLKGETTASKAESKKIAAPQSPPFYDAFTSPVRMRSMALASPSSKEIDSTSPPKSSLQDKIQSKMQEAFENLKRKPIISFFWGELPDAKRRQTFAKAEPIILLIEGLSHFVAASFVEDKYGVVQKDLPEILCMLLDLQAAVEQRGPSTGAITKRTEAFTSSPTDVQLKHRLKRAIKSSIYRIVVRFQLHILNVPLPPTQKRMLEQYLEFLVG
ncbi:hypothetical protein GHT06_018015 [Daphnia sinensis]|uniref:Nucleoporin NDC1 n=1 Tax=Daphnia sinensis TaxID=1820382 RepID=A0AAD5L571_9CRUS|nr:hypothetical protein GHT06_018015 [Daphnia sinensis]